MSNSSSQKQRKSTEAQAEEKWRKRCRDEAPALNDQLLKGDFQPKFDLGDWFIARYSEALALYPDHPKNAKRAWKSLFKTKDFPTKTKPWTYTTADRFMLIAKCEFIRNPENWPSIAELGWTTLYEMTKLTREQFERGKSLSLKWTRNSINNLRHPPTRKGGKGQGQASSPDGRQPFPGGNDEPRERWDLTLTGSSPLHIGGEATINTLQWFHKQIKKIVTLATQTRADFRLATNTERSETTV